MAYLISFLEGVVTFISPCLLPMLPVYISYFAGGGEHSTGRTIRNALGFVTGFTLVFVPLGALAGTLGGFLRKYQTAVNLITGLIVVFFGLSILGVFKFSLFRGAAKGPEADKLGFLSSALFGVVFSLSWTPCVGAFLGSALMLASQQGQILKGVVMMLLYSLGLGVPFLISALLIDKLKNAFGFIKRHYRAVNLVCGGLLIAVGALMAAGLFGKFIHLLP